VSAATDVHELRHGYNIADLERLAAFSTRRLYGVTTDPRDRYAIAWSAIAEHLYSADQRPDPNELIITGQTAIARNLHKELHHHGTAKDYQPMPKYAIYWETVIRHTPSPEGRIVDRTALWQIWPQLTPVERSAVHAYAVHGTHQAAADALGIPYKTFAWRLSAARRRFLALWHEGETPSGLWRTELRSKTGVKTTPAHVAKARLAQFADLHEGGLVQQDIAARMGLSYRTVQRLAAQYRAERGL
jgi:DNA-directed RNA polymerase specialized sigma24 family protein